jgi:hypothetical protein
MSVGVVEGEEFKTMLCDSVAFLTYFLFSLLLLLLPTYLLTYLPVRVPRPRTHDDRAGRVFPDHLITYLCFGFK